MTDEKPAARPTKRRLTPPGTPFEKGKSGNPKGRPKGARGLSGLLKEALEVRVVEEDGKEISKLEAAVRRIADSAAGGDPRMLQMLLAELRRLEPSRPEPAPHDCMDVVREEMKGAHARLTEKLAKLRAHMEREEEEARAKGLPCPTCGAPQKQEGENQVQSIA
jgi:hypothetical protein